MKRLLLILFFLVTPISFLFSQSKERPSFEAGKLKDFVSASGKQVLEYIGFQSTPKTYAFQLANWSGSVLKIYQKRTSGSGNLTLDGFILVYGEE